MTPEVGMRLVQATAGSEPVAAVARVSRLT
jgi:hypothetical protein